MGHHAALWLALLLNSAHASIKQGSVTLAGSYIKKDDKNEGGLVTVVL